MMAKENPKTRKHEAPPMTIKAFRLALLTTVVVLATAATAFAQSPADTVYNTNGGVLNVVSGGGGNDKTPPAPQGVAGSEDTTPTTTRETGTTTPVATSTGSLPFTGFQAGLVAAAGLALVG